MCDARLSKADDFASICTNLIARMIDVRAPSTFYLGLHSNVVVQDRTPRSLTYACP